MGGGGLYFRELALRDHLSYTLISCISVYNTPPSLKTTRVHRPRELMARISRFIYIQIYTDRYKNTYSIQTGFKDDLVYGQHKVVMLVVVQSRFIVCKQNR